MLLGVAAGGGATAFALLVWRPVWREPQADESAPVEPQTWGEAIGVGLRRLVFVGAIVVLAAGTLLLVNQAATGGNVSWFRAFDGPLQRDLATRSGRICLPPGARLIFSRVVKRRPAPT